MARPKIYPNATARSAAFRAKKRQEEMQRMDQPSKREVAREMLITHMREVLEGFSGLMEYKPPSPDHKNFRKPTVYEDKMAELEALTKRAKRILPLRVGGQMASTTVVKELDEARQEHHNSMHKT